MNNYDYLNVQKVCRACLNEENEMKTMILLKNDTKEVGLLEMFVSIVSTEVNTSDATSSNLCNACEETLKLSYNFQQQCRKSNQILEAYAKKRTNDSFSTRKDDETESADAYKMVDETSNDCHPEQLPIKKEAVDDNSREAPEETTYSEPENSEKVETNSKLGGIKQNLRLKQFPPREVEAAIKATRANFYTNVECIKCGFVGTHSRALSIHMSHLHKEVKERWCIECNEEFDNYAEHERNHKKNHLKCQFCGKDFNSRGHLLEHLRAHSVVRPFICDVCTKCFVSQRHLAVHFRIHSQEAPYKCKFCVASFKQQSLLRNHHKRRHKDISLNCELKEDKIELWEPQNFCGVCNANVLSLQAHNKQMHGENLPKECTDANLNKELCTVCGKQFNNIAKYRMHMRIHTGETPYKCSFCNKRINTRNQLVVHERTHTGEKPHICHVCGKGFAQSSVLNTHLRIHTGRPEVCQICQQRFCRPAELRLHMRKHTGEKPFLCTECGQAFVQRSHLVEHNKIHSDIRPYQCTYCDKAFKQNSSLKSHIYIHLGNKPFKCNQCTYSCRQSYSLTQHMKGHTNDTPRPDQPHVCSICCKTFSTVAVLTSHVSNTHGIVTS